jgi:hypothetical protein
VDAEEGRVLKGVDAELLRREGEEATPLFTAAADHAAAGTLVVRGTALPASLAAVVSAAAEALPGCVISCDVMSGRLRAALDDVGEIDAFALTVLRRRLEALGGSLTLERAPLELAEQVGVYGDRGRVAVLDAAIRTRFDPGGVLAPGRFGS